MDVAVFAQGLVWGTTPWLKLSKYLISWFTWVPCKIYSKIKYIHIGIDQMMESL